MNHLKQLTVMVLVLLYERKLVITQEEWLGIQIILVNMNFSMNFVAQAEF